MDDKLESITSLATKFEESHILHKVNDNFGIALAKAQEHIAFLEAENARLQNIVASIPSLLPKTNEELICEMEIDKLLKTSTQRNLTLEETKRLDLVIKNLYLCKESKEKPKPDYKSLPQGVTEATLVDIASKPADKADEG